MAMALALPRLLDRVEDRPVMMAAALALVALSLGLAVGLTLGMGWGAMLAGWAGIGALWAAILTPSGRLLRRSAHAGDRPAVFAAQFALSHACWLVTYPLAGWAGVTIGLGPTLGLLALLGLGAVAVAWRVWPQDAEGVIAHRHPDLPPDHPHLREGHDRHGTAHSHDFVIDDLHPHWPGRQG